MINLEQVNKFRQEFMGKYYKPITEKQWQEILDQPNFHIIEVHIDQKLAGLILGHQIKNLTRNVLIMDDAIVDKDCRGMGIGTFLYEAMIKLAQKLGTDCIEGAVGVKNKPTRHIYEKLDYKDRKNILYRLWLNQKK